MDMFFKIHAYGLIVFSLWMVYAFAKEWKENYSASRKKN